MAQPLKEQHPYNNPECVPADTRLLIVGTAPPPRFSKGSPCYGMRGLDFDFYYGSEDNYMWQFLGEIADDINYSKKPLFTDEEKAEACEKTARTFLQKHKIWMYDTLQSYQRNAGRETSASDADIGLREFTDFTPVFLKLIGLEAIAFTSEQAAIWTFEAFRERNLIAAEQYKLHEERLARWRSIKIALVSRQNDIEMKFGRPFLNADILGRPLNFYLLPSPTGRSRMGLKINDKKEIYKKVIFGY